MPTLTTVGEQTAARRVHRRHVVGAVLLLAVIVRMAGFVGYQGRDDRNYIAYAEYVASGKGLESLEIRNQWVGRVGFWMPVAATIKTLGSTQAAYAAHPMLVSLAGILLTFALASVTVGARAGALAALLLAVFPLDVLYATRPYPDVPLGVAMVAAFWLALRSREKPASGVLAGLALGLAYLYKETALFAVVPIALALRFWQPRSWRALALIAVTFGVVVGAELAFWASVKGDPLYRFHATDGALSAVRTEAAPSSGLLAWIPGPRPTEAYRSTNTIADAALMLGTNEELVLLYWFLLPIMAVAAIHRDRETADLRLWILVLLPMMLFLPVVPPYHTMPRDPRYLTCLTIPALLVFASYVLRASRRTQVTVLACFLATSVCGIFLGRESSRMEPQLTLLERTRAGERLWLTPQYASDLIFLSGVDRDLPLGIHLLQQRRTAGSFETATVVWPEISVLETAAEIGDGTVVLRETRQMPALDGWAVVERLSPQASWPVRQVQRLLQAGGLGSFARKLDPGGGNVAVLYRREEGAAVR